MGRRSINTTKSGKFMNPTDQARKEARKKELKKNKKQRQMVRAAVLKGKDPNHLIGEMEKIDRMEYDVNNPPLLNEKVLKDKRKKLRETFARVMKLYEKEDPDQYKELRKLEGEYEIKRNFLVKYYESVKHAQQVQVEDIPLPSMQMPSLITAQIPLPSDIPLPTAMQQPTHSILKKTSIYEQVRELLDANQWSKVKMPPGVPPGLPPPLSDVEDEEDDDDENESADVEMTDASKDDNAANGTSSSEKPRKIRFADDDAKSAEEDKDTRLTLSKAGKRLPLEDAIALPPSAPKGGPGAPANESRPSVGPIPPNLQPGLLPPGPPPGLPPMMFRPPPMRPPVRLPPGPPPGRPPGLPGPPPGLPPRMLGPPPTRLPPGPPPGMPPPRLMRPPGMPPSGMHHPLGMMSSMQQSGANSVLSAPPSLISRPKLDDDHKKSATIEAKPQIRNLSADVTRFMPTSLRVKREERTKKREQRPQMLGLTSDDVSISMMKHAPIAAPTKDDAYDQFMREMEDLL